MKLPEKPLAYRKILEKLFLNPVKNQFNQKQNFLSRIMTSKSLLHVFSLHTKFNKKKIRGI